MHEDEIKNIASQYANLKDGRDSLEEKYFNPIGCAKYDAFLAGAKWMEDKINALKNED
jgi:hypothetical protein